MRPFSSLPMFFVLCAALILPITCQAQRSKELVPTQGVLAGKTVYTNSFALVIGCGTYPNLPADKQLDFARKDALAMRALLIRSYGFLPDNVILLLDEDATKTNIEQALNRFTDTKTVRSTDRLFVYFSGHGQTVTSSDGQTDGFLVPTDAKVDLDKPHDVAGYVQTCVSMQKVRAFLEDSPAQHCLVMADACFSGFLVRGKGGKLADKALAHLAAEPAHQVLAAGGRGESAWEDPRLGNSVFTYACLQSLRDNAKEEGSVLLTSELGAGVKRVVLELTGGKQTPQAGNVKASEGEFLFVATLPQHVPDAKSGLPVGSSGVFGTRVQAVEAANDANVKDNQKDYVEAERLYKKAIELDPEYSSAYNNLGSLNYNIKHDYVEAERQWRKTIEVDPKFSLAYYNLGNLNYNQKKDYVEAERLYKKAIEVDPNDSIAYNKLGLLNKNIKQDYVEAERLFKKAIEVDPNDSSTYNNLGSLNCNQKKDYVEAERLYKKAIEVDPKSSLAYSNLGLLNYNQKKDYVEAERLYKKALELDANDSFTYNSLGNLNYYQKKDYVEAERLYKKAIELDPNDSSAYNNLGLLNYNQKKDYVEAERLYKKAIEVDPNDSSTYNNLGLLNYNQKKDYVEAERLYKKAIEVDPNDSSAYDHLGSLNCGVKHDYVEGERLFKKAIELDPKDSLLYVSLALALLLQGKRDEALVAARHAQELGLKDNPAYKVLGL